MFAPATGTNICSHTVRHDARNVPGSRRGSNRAAAWSELDLRSLLTEPRDRLSVGQDRMRVVDLSAYRALWRTRGVAGLLASALLARLPVMATMVPVSFLAK